ncbi:dihydrolipoyl dehydrogenase [Deferrisoma camini]|uniref:dihydrolipoyl dehydrogenase n=1 Tax=Deferrisoma camini TaxID=1035120 RepID=UPI00046CD64B|nr:dihydrolipoyl dehydrogenase [Deferrisoma camini]
MAGYDLVVIGAGPGGYTAAARAAELGLRTACVEREERPGGVCLRVGCIPSKALLDSSLRFAELRAGLGAHGIGVEAVTLDLPAMMARKDAVVQRLTEGVRRLLERAGVDLVRGTARLAGPGRVGVTPPDGGEATALETRAVLLATGSEPVPIPAAPVDGDRIVDSTGALVLDEVPEHLVVVGGGFIGLELGSVWARLGSRVTVVELLPTVASGLDGQAARALGRSLRKQGLEIRTRTRVLATRAEGERVWVEVQAEGKEPETLECDRVLVAVGRRPLLRGLGLETVGVDPDPSTGRIPVDEAFRTRAQGVLAVGDLVDGPMLAHKAAMEGIAAVENLAGIAARVNPAAIPAVAYTHPEAAGVGPTEEDLKRAGTRYRKGVFSFGASGRALCSGEAEGFVKVLVDEATDRVLAAHMLGPRVSDLIAEAVLAVEMAASAEDLARTAHAHPTFAEALWEACRMATRD